MQIIYLVLLFFLLRAVYTDMTQTKISNRLIAVGLFTAFFFRIGREGSIGVLFFLINIIIPVILLYLLFQMRALGAGDIKLFSMLGAFISTEQLIKIMLWAFVTGAVLGMIKMVYKWIFQGCMCKELTQIHFSSAILIAYVVVIGGGIWQG